MAQMIRETDSTDRVQNTSRRHSRLCGFVKGTETLVTNINAGRDSLAEKEAILKQARENREDAHDFMLLQEDNLDKYVKTISEKCSQFDRENAGISIFNLIFTDGKITTITKTKSKNKPNAVEQLILRLESLGKDHALFPLVAELRQKLTNFSDAMKNFNDLEKEEKKARTQELLARTNLCHIYENNYLDARKMFGRDLAERLFPKFLPGGKNDSDSNNPPDPPAPQS